MAQQQKGPGLSQSIAQLGPSGRGGGGGGMEQTLSAFIQSMQQGASKLLQVMQAQQQENVMANQQARESAAGGVTEVLNQVASGIRGRDTAREDQQTQEQREYNEELLIWQREMAQEAQKEGARLELSLKQQEQARINYIEDYDKRLNTIRDNNLANRRKLEGMADVFFDLPDGPAKYAEAMRALDHSDDLYETHQHAPYAAKANKITNEALSRILQSDDPLGQVSNLSADPRLLPLPNLQQDFDETTLPTLGWKDRLEWDQGQGYPTAGVQGVGSNDSKLRHVVPYTKASSLKAMMTDANMRMFVTKKSRQMFKDADIQKLLEAEKVTGPILEAERNFREVFEQVAPNAVSQGIQAYLTDPNPHKRDKMADTLVAKIMANMVPEHGEEFAKRAFGIRDGTITLSTQSDVYHAIAAKAAASAVGERLIEMQADPNGPHMRALMNDLAANPNALNEFGVTPSGRVVGKQMGGMVAVTENPISSLHRRVWGLMSEMGGTTSRIKHAAREQVPVKQLYSEVGTVRRLADAYTISGPSIDTGPDGVLDEKEVQKVLQSVASQTGPSTEFRRNIGLLEATGILFQNSPDKIGGLMDLYSGGGIKIEDPNLKTFQASVDLGRQTDGYLDGVVKTRMAEWDAETQMKKAKQAEQQMQQSQQGQPIPGGQPAQAPQGGVAGTLGGMVGSMARTGVEGMKAAGGVVQQGLQTVGEGAKTLGQAVADPMQQAGQGFMQEFNRGGQ